MLLTRLVDECAWKLHKQGRIDMIARAYGHEAAQVGSAVCIERGTDFTLPYYRDLGVVLTIGMTPYEVFRTYLQAQQNGSQTSVHQRKNNTEPQHTMHWGYHKYNTVTGPAPVATQILHAAGIAFASKLRKAPVVTVAYCGDGATCEADFREGVQFAALHQLPVVFVCEQDCSLDETTSTAISSIREIDLPSGLTYKHIDGADIVAVYTTMSEAMRHAREGHGPVLLEMGVSRSLPDSDNQRSEEYGEDSKCLEQERVNSRDPLICCKQILEQRGSWDDVWVEQLRGRFNEEVEQAVQDALRDTTDF
jgi:2-oxoisovalerate dehydrogenase E1 component alpha subunit